MHRAKLFFLFFLTAICFSAPSVAQLQLLDKVAAVVNDDVIMASELQEQVAIIYQRISASGTQPPPQEVLVPQVLEKLIQDRLQLSMGLRAGVKISDAELNQAMTRLAQQQNLGLDEFLAIAAREGLNPAALKAQMKDEMIIARVQQSQVQRRFTITDQDIDNFLKSEEGKFLSSPDVNVGHILLPVSSGADKETVQQVLDKAENLRQQATNGADFRQLAIAHSSGQNALQGGDIGWRKSAQLPGIFSTVLAALQPGGISAPIRSDAGFHLLKLYDRRGNTEELIQQSMVRHILIKPNEIRSEEDARTMLLDLRARIAAGEDFADIARQFSEDSGSALNGGSVGWSVPGQFVPQFEQAIEQAQINVVSEPFRTQYGWHILEVTERRHQDFSTEIMRNQAQNVLRQRKFEEELPIWLQEIRDEAFIDIKL